MLWNILKHTLKDLWYESWFLVLFNILWILSTIPGLLLISNGLFQTHLPLILIGLILSLPSPLATFGLFYVAHHISQDKVLHLKTFFTGALAHPKQAYQWAIINTLITSLLLFNIKFYNNPTIPLGQNTLGLILGAFFAAITFLWLIIQLFTLTLYPRLNTQQTTITFSHITKQALKHLLPHPILSVFVGLLAIIIALIGWYGAIIGVCISISAIVILLNRTTQAIEE